MPLATPTAPSRARSRRRNRGRPAACDDTPPLDLPSRVTSVGSRSLDASSAGSLTDSRQRRAAVSVLTGTLPRGRLQHRGRQGAAFPSGTFRRDRAPGPPEFFRFGTERPMRSRYGTTGPTSRSVRPGSSAGRDECTRYRPLNPPARGTRPAESIVASPQPPAISAYLRRPSPRRSSDCRLHPHTRSARTIPLPRGSGGTPPRPAIAIPLRSSRRATWPRAAGP